MNRKESAAARPAGLSVLLVVALCCVASVGVYIFARDLDLRNWWLSLTPHRWSFEMPRVRQTLAPRSILLAGFLLGALAAACLVAGKARAFLSEKLPARKAGAVAFACGMFICAVAVCINLHAYYLRQYSKPVWAVEDERVLAYTLPKIWEDSRRLAKSLPPGSNAALDAPERYLFWFPALNYPIAFYRDKNAELNWLEGSNFASYAKRRHITHVLRYAPDTQHSEIVFEPIDQWLQRR